MADVVQVPATFTPDVGGDQSTTVVGTEPEAWGTTDGDGSYIALIPGADPAGGYLNFTSVDPAATEPYIRDAKIKVTARQMDFISGPLEVTFSLWDAGTGLQIGTVTDSYVFDDGTSNPRPPYEQVIVEIDVTAEIINAWTVYQAGNLQLRMEAVRNFVGGPP